ncbi:hypothetical protein J14TS5_57690 [Paenibacillus lautus]|uniref:phosphoethanolamine transferase CptA n=1 Tax=Paenibacillus lautus TaxID=1401 RepID=UPI001B2AA33D|nr:phosphoethanolamine transferase CptA [Paenibacillus lautus]GIP00684.1 hypothetical protein J14TS5_57690 [Paenibacillus lautus]
MRVAKYFVLWFVFIWMFTGTIVGLEYIEGYKIATTEYYGLRNMGLVLVIIPIFLSSILYPVIVLPLSWVIGMVRWVRASLTLYALLYAVMWAGAGAFLFYESYDARFIEEYELHVSTAIILFGVVGLVYAWIEWRLLHRPVTTV